MLTNEATIDDGAVVTTGWGGFGEPDTGVSGKREVFERTLDDVVDRLLASDSGVFLEQIRQLAGQ